MWSTPNPVTGYGGMALNRLLLNYPHVEITAVLSPSQAGRDLATGYHRE